MDAKEYFKDALKIKWIGRHTPYFTNEKIYAIHGGAIRNDRSRLIMVTRLRPSDWEVEARSRTIRGTHPSIYIADEVDYPEGNPKAAIGATKPSMSVVPPVALLQLSTAMQDGAKKYGAMNWRASGVNALVYYNACMRHLFAWFDGEEKAGDSGVHHLAHAMACLAIIMDAEASQKLTDDRPQAGCAGPMIKALTKDKAA